VKRAHGHGGEGHSHAVRTDADRRYLLIALLLLAAFMVAEVLVAIVSGSLVLLSDAGTCSPTSAPSVGPCGRRLAARPASGAWTYGWKRAEILRRRQRDHAPRGLGHHRVRGHHPTVRPSPIDGGAILVVAIVGVGVNLVATWVLAKANRSSLNVEGAYQHIVTDLYAFLGTVIAAVIIMTTGYVRADSIAALVVVALMLRAAWGLLRDSGRSC
jgi:cobalt-zinc-cadmium efflux system protein